MARWCVKAQQEVIAMSSLYGRDLWLVTRIQAMRQDQLARLAERQEKLKQVGRWDHGG